jgi:uncharacterized alkaline shock family protein YloU
MAAQVYPEGQDDAMAKSSKEPHVVVATAPEEGGGSLTISQTVLAEIAVTEALGIDGVSLRHPPDRKGMSLEDVTVQTDGREAVFQMRIRVRHGLRMPDVAKQLRASIAKAVHEKTGQSVRAVNVVVERVVREAAPKEA